jgi:MFS family permease
MADLYGRRRLFIIGGVLFGVGSVACAAAPNEEVLIASRALEGAGGALVIPLGYAIATGAVPEERRGWAIGIVSSGATVFLALGPLIGGTLVVLVGWRWIFLLNVPLIVAIVAIAVTTFPESRQAREPLDVTGFVLLVSGLVCLVLALLNVHDWGAGSPVTVSLFVAGVGLLGGFVVREHRTEHPLIDLKLLQIPVVTGSLCALFAIQFSILGLTVYLTLYLQSVLAYSPAAAGALALPLVAAAPLLSAPVGRSADRIGSRLLTAGSMLLAAVALAAIALLADQREVLLLLPAFLAFGIARPIATVAATAAAVGATPQAVRGLSTALVTESRQLGAVMGVAVLGLVLNAIGHGAAGDQSGSANAVSPAGFVSGFRGAMLVSALLAAAAAAISWRLMRPAPERVQEPAEMVVSARAPWSGELGSGRQGPVGAPGRRRPATEAKAR